MSPEWNKKIWTAVKTLTFILCLAGFAWNSSGNFKQFIGRQTITSQDLQHNEKLALPSFTLCSLSSFKEKITKYQDLELKSYLNNTLDLDEILVAVQGPNGQPFIGLKQLKELTTLWEVSTTYSQFRGRCHTIRYIPKVTSKHLILSNSIFYL